MRRRHNQRKMDLSFSLDEQQSDQQDELNEEYVQKKRAAKKGTKNTKKAPKKGGRKQLDESQNSNSNSEDIIEFKHNDQQARQHVRPSFMQRWNGFDNQLEIFPSEYERLSPMLKVYWDTKSKNMNAIIFLQFGKMEYFAFENDAIRLHEIFKKKLKKFSDFLMVNFWCKEVLVAKQQLFDRGVPVLMMNEFSDPIYRSQHGIIRRQIDQVITPGIHLDMEDKAYKERWFMTFYVVDIKESMSKRLGSRKQESSIEILENQPKKACVILLDSESNKFYIEQFEVDEKLHDVRRVINRYRPVELLLSKTSSNHVRTVKQIARQICSPYIIEIGYDRQNQKVPETLERFIKDSKAPLFKHLLQESIKEKKTDHNFDSFATVKCLDLVHLYLSNMKLNNKIFDEGIFEFSCLNQAKLKPFFDSQVYENLEIFRIKNEDQGQAKKGTLIAYLDHCLTNSGKKLMRRWINEPLTNIDSILQRQECFKQIVENEQYSLLITFHQKLIAYEKVEKNVADVYHWVIRGYQKNFHKLTADLTFEKDYDQKKNPAISRIKEIIRILNLLGQFQNYLSDIKPFKLKSKYWRKFTQIALLNQKQVKKIEIGQEKLEQIPEIKKISESILKKIDYNESTDFLEPTPGHYQDYDCQKAAKLKVQQQLQKELQKYKSFYNNQKITFVSVRARNQIQIPKICLKSRKDRPKQLVFSSETANFERYTTAKTNELSEQLMIHEQRISRSYEPFMHEIIEEFCQHKFIWNKYVEAISEIDVLFSIAQVCKRMSPRSLPKFCLDDQSSVISINKAFHPGLIQVLEPNQLVSNSLQMKKLQRFLLLTGPNMGGKSTILRQTCLLAILAQIGCYVPCESYQSIVFDQIFCRIGSSDRIIEGKSTFYVELEETNRILKQATSSSLVIIDELGRGTSTYDGMAIAQATIDFILENIGCYTLFSTHYTPITRDFLCKEEVKCAKMSYKLTEKSQCQKNSTQQKLQFLYQVQPGVAQKSFANNVARMVGLPQQILIEADKKAQWISQLHQKAQQKWKKTKNLNFLVDLSVLKQKQKDVEI